MAVHQKVAQLNPCRSPRGRRSARAPYYHTWLIDRSDTRPSGCGSACGCRSGGRSRLHQSSDAARTPLRGTARSRRENRLVSCNTRLRLVIVSLPTRSSVPSRQSYRARPPHGRASGSSRWRTGAAASAPSPDLGKRNGNKMRPSVDVPERLYPAPQPPRHALVIIVDAAVPPLREREALPARHEDLML